MPTHVHRQKSIQQLVHSAPTIKKCWSYVAITLKTKFEMHMHPHANNFLATGGCFERVTALGWLKKDDEKF